MRSSRGDWNNQIVPVESNRTIDNTVGLNPNLSGNNRKLQNIRKTRYVNNGHQAKSNENQKSYRGPVHKAGGISMNHQ